MLNTAARIVVTFQKTVYVLSMYYETDTLSDI